MGSGCQQGKAFSNCFTTVSDLCVMYTGDPIESLGICTGDNLKEVEAVILTKIQEQASGAGIELADITPNCQFIADLLLGKDKSLGTLLQAAFDAECTLYSLIQQIQSDVNSPYAFDLKCLTTPANPSRDDIMQSLINNGCANTADIAQIKADLANTSTDPDSELNTILGAVADLVGNMLGTQLSSCQGGVVKLGTGATTTVQFNAQVPIRGMVFGDFNLSSFDNTGLGLASAGMCGWALANSNNGTLDMRGFTASGATAIQGPTLNAAVNPGSDIDLQTSVGAVKGKAKYTLSSSQLPNHTHSINDPGHSHPFDPRDRQGISDNANDRNVMVPGSQSLTTGSATTGITIGGVTGTTGQPIDNRQPTRYGVWIQRIA
jgi:microcystin-dependent protein